MAPTPIVILPTCYNASWLVSDESSWTLLGEFKTDSSVGATRSSTIATITGLNRTSVYWLQVTSADAVSSQTNTISLSGFTQVTGTNLIDYHSKYSAILSGYYKVTGTPKVTTDLGYSSTYKGIVTILINEVTSS